ncbi:MAG: 5-dehydro-2-deoxygluconokinase [Actinomycetaceae bacterium]|nr:5-dehydro-2-deoxygluconokinase [Actinomycetaceae bacterium]
MSIDKPYDLITIGRCGVDIYPLQSGVGLENVSSFGKFLGGSPTNVAVACSRLGHNSAIVTGVGDDPFGRFVREEVKRLGVANDFVVTTPDFNTPVTFCEIFPPDNFPLYFYREPSAPDLQLSYKHLPIDDIDSAKIFWISVTGLSEEPSRSAHMYALEHRLDAQRRVASTTSAQSESANRLDLPLTIVDLDYRPMFWQNRKTATSCIKDMLPYVDVAVGNKEECEVAVGESEPDKAADALLEYGVKLAIVKQGPLGTLAKTVNERFEIPVTEVEVVNGLGAGDSFGGSLCHGLLQGWSIHKTIAGASIAGAIVASRLECSTAMPTEDEILAILDKGGY